MKQRTDCLKYGPESLRPGAPQVENHLSGPRISAEVRKPVGGILWLCAREVASGTIFCMGFVRVAFMLVFVVVACAPAPQADGGDGWRLLVSEPGVGGVWVTGFFNSPAELRRFWLDKGIPGEEPDVEWETEAVVFFGPAVNSNCPDVRLRDVTVEGQKVRPEIDVVGDGQGCNDDDNPYTFLVAIERRLLPEPPFTIELLPDACESVPLVCREQRTTVTSEDLTVIPLMAFDDDLLDRTTIPIWWNAIGLVRRDHQIWTERLSEACTLGVWDRNVAEELAARYITEDEPVAHVDTEKNPPSLYDAAQALRSMAAQVCGDAFPPGELTADSSGADWGPLAVGSWEHFGDGVGGGPKELRIGESCVSIVGEDGVVVLPVWPEDRTAWDGRTGVLSFDGEEFTDGDMVGMGGIPESPVWWVARPDDRCPGEIWTIASLSHYTP